MRKKGYVILLTILMFIILLFLIKYAIGLYQKNKFQKHVIKEYNFEISYPNSYKTINSSKEEISDVLSSLTVEESGDKTSEYIQNMNFVETVRNLKNERNGIKLIIEAINTEKTSLSIEEICKRYIAMFKVYNDDKVIKESMSELIHIKGNDGGKVNIKVKGENEDAIINAFLFPLNDKEITITFIGPEKAILNYESEINKIINSLKTY